MGTRINKLISLALGLFISIIAMGYFTHININNLAQARRNHLNYFYKKELSGKVIQVYTNSKNHNFQTVVLDNDGIINSVILNFDRSGLFNFLLSGDSIYKSNNSEDVEVYRNGCHIKSFTLSID